MQIPNTYLLMIGQNSLESIAIDALNIIKNWWIHFADDKWTPIIVGTGAIAAVVAIVFVALSFGGSGPNPRKPDDDKDKKDKDDKEKKDKDNPKKPQDSDEVTKYIDEVQRNWELYEKFKKIRDAAEKSLKGPFDK